MPLTPGTRLGPYEILAPIGAGGMGEVYRAKDTRLHRTVALKTLPGEKFADPERKRRFLQEARTASALNHPNIITLYDISSDSGVDYLVMEYLPGKPLNQLITPTGLSLDVVVEYTLQMAGALAAAHAAGVIHRDIKPANAIVTEEGQVKLLDFGLAKLVQDTPDPEGGTQTMEPSLTAPGAIMGTPAYMSPEQARGEPLDARSDLFSLGVVLYQMATGRRPFSQALNWAPPPIDVLPPELRRIAGKLLEVDLDLRYQHASDLRADLLILKRDTDSTRSQSAVSPTSRKHWKAILASAAVLPLLAVGYYYSRRAPKLTDKDTIILGDFRNGTGDPVFDDTLRQGLSSQLRQSPFLSLVSDEKIHGTLGLMGRPPDSRLTPELAREVCERAASAAVLDGSIVPLGGEYVLGLRARNCHTGDLLDEQQVQVARKEDVLTALSQIASKFRAKAGESLATVEKHSAPLAEATTQSLEALKAFSSALKVAGAAGDAAALPLMKRAVQLDPTFAMAHAILARLYQSTGEPELAAQSTIRAWQLRARTSDAERFLITASYDVDVTGNLKRAQETCELWALTYPRDLQAHAFLAGMVYSGLGKYEKGVESATKAIALEPDFGIAYFQLSFHNMFLNRLAAAESALQRASDRKLATPFFIIQRFDLAFLKGDKVGMEREAALARLNSGFEDWMLDQEALVLAFHGHLQQARAVSRQAVNLSKQTNKVENAALWEAGAAVREAFFGNLDEARRSATVALSLSKARDVEYGAAFALALAGDILRAQALATDLEKRLPEDTGVKYSYLPVLRAHFALAQGDAAKAIELLRFAVPYELSVPTSGNIGLFGSLYPIYLRGQANLAARQGAEAAKEFQRIIDHRTIALSDPMFPLARLQLARALALSGDGPKAKAAYQEFLTFWQEADPGIPILKQAKAEYDRLR